ncbi:MAG: hypothetical protein RSA91_05265 [Bacilli bacterium]
MNNIKTDVVKNVLVNGVYQVSNADLHIHATHGRKHDVVVCSIDKKNNTAIVKTITSLERSEINEKTGKRGYKFIHKKLSDVRSGEILPIAKIYLKTNHYSGIDHRQKKVALDKIHYKEPKDKTVFPWRFKDLIKNK